MSVEFTVVFESDGISANAMNEFRTWFSSQLKTQVFENVLEGSKIDLYFGPVIETLSFKEEV